MKKKLMMIVSPALALILSPWTVKAEQNTAKPATPKMDTQGEAASEDIAQSEIVFDRLLASADIENGHVSGDHIVMRHDR